MTNQPQDGLTTAATPDAYLDGYDGFEKEWLSTSALSLLMTCGVAFNKRYIDRTPEPVHVRQGAGLGVHRGRELNLKYRIAQQEYLPLDDVQDATRDDVQHRMDTHEYGTTPEFEHLSEQQAKGFAADLAVEMVTADYDEFQIELVPQDVEMSIAVDFPGLSRLIVGKVDTLLDNFAIVDLKTGKRAYGEHRAIHSMGLTTYGMLVYSKYGVLPPYYEIQNVVRAKTHCKTNVYQISKPKEELERQLMRFLRACEIIDAGLFLPCDPEHWKCSPEWCGYFYQCEYGGDK